MSMRTARNPQSARPAGEGGSGLSRRRFIHGTAAAGAVLAFSRIAPSAHAFPVNGEGLLSLSTVDVAKLIRERGVSAVEVVERCFERIDYVNPMINAVVATARERALDEARSADAALARGRLLGPLHGVPFTIKDSFDTTGVVSTGGTLGRRHYVPGEDATVVARLRDAGGIMVGKSNTPEFTLGGGGRGTLNLIHGVTRNPYNLDYQPSGSSGGAGAIVAAAGAYFDIGTDYGGSIRGPAFANGIAGLKPTLGRVPRTGHIIGYGGPFDSWQEAGPMARTVDDLTLLMGIIDGPDDWDAAMAPVPLGDPRDVELSRLRVAWYGDFGSAGTTEEVQATVRQCVGYFSALGCRVTEDRPPEIENVGQLRNAIQNANGRDHMRRLLAMHGTHQASPGLSLTGNVLSSAEFTELYERMDAIRSEQLAWLEQYDLVICPANSRAPVPLDYERPPGAVGGMSHLNPYNVNGWPAGVVRCGTSTEAPGLPLGDQVVGQPWLDHVVLAAMAHIEQMAGGWAMPPI